jgi:hypothetical protein
MLSGLGVISPRPPRAAMAISAARRLKRNFAEFREISQ